MDKARRTTSLIGAAVIALALAACAKTVTPASSGSTPASTSTPAATGVTIKTASVSGVGTVLVDSSGRTLYMLTADQGGMVTCNSSACTSTWPPVIVPAGAKVQAGAGVDSSKLGTAKTASGATQVTYNNWPLYRYSGDSGAGQANGQGINSFGGVWHPLDGAGKQVMSSTSSSSSSTSGYGY